MCTQTAYVIFILAQKVWKITLLGLIRGSWWEYVYVVDISESLSSENIHNTKWLKVYSHCNTHFLWRYITHYRGDAPTK